LRRKDLNGKLTHPFANLARWLSVIRKFDMPIIDSVPSAEVLAAITEATIVSRSRSVLASELHGETVMMNIANGGYFGLDDVGSEVWRRIEPPCTFATLVEQLAADYGESTAVVASDVRLLLARMSEKDAVILA